MRSKHLNSNSGKSFARVEISKEDKGHLAIISEISEKPTQKLLGIVVKKFIENNRKLILEYEKATEKTRSELQKKINKGV
ncbi:hypothetical protein ACFYEP_02865 [Streptococcus pyogenes]